MYARIYDRSRKTYYYSMVYGVLNENRYFIVKNPFTKTFDLIEPFYETQHGFRTAIKILDNDAGGFSTYCDREIYEFRRYCKSRGLNARFIREISGYGNVVFDEFLYDLLSEKRVPVDRYHVEEVFPDHGIWKEIQTQKDADEFLEVFMNFHDSTIEKAVYEESNKSNIVNIIFDNTGWYGTVKIRFEGVTELVIRPSVDGDRWMLGGTLLVNENGVFWGDFPGVDPNSADPCGSYIRAQTAKWMKIKGMPQDDLGVIIDERRPNPDTD